MAVTNLVQGGRATKIEFCFFFKAKYVFFSYDEHVAFHDEFIDLCMLIFQGYSRSFTTFQKLSASNAPTNYYLIFRIRNGDRNVDALIQFISEGFTYRQVNDEFVNGLFIHLKKNMQFHQKKKIALKSPKLVTTKRCSLETKYNPNPNKHGLFIMSKPFCAKRNLEYRNSRMKKFVLDCPSLLNRATWKSCYQNIVLIVRSLSQFLHLIIRGLFT